MDRKSDLARTLRVGVSGLVLAWAGAVQALPVFSGNAQASGGAGGLPVIRTLGPDLVTVDLNARRTIIDWTSFNLAPGETVSYASFINQNIVLNRVANGPININGLISSAQSDTFPLTQPVTPGGNIWFFSPQGVIFGPNARFVGGALLATSAAVNTTQFLNETIFEMDFTGTGNGGPITVAAGANFTARGHLALVAPIVKTDAGSVFNAGDYGTVLYGGVDSYRINFISIANNDLSFFDFIIPAGVAGGSNAPTPLDIAGQTTGANVYLSAISRSGLGGLLINAPGLLVGASSFNNYGQVTITTGRNITLGQVNETSTPVVGAQTGDIRVGTITASGNVNLVSTGTSGAGNITADRLQIGQASLITARNLTVGSQGIRTGDSNVFGGGLNINASGVVDVPLVNTRVNFNVFSNLLQFNGSINTQNDLPMVRLGSVNVGGIANINGTSIQAASVTSAQQTFLFSNTFINATTVNAGTLARMGANGAITLGSVTGADLDIRSAMGVTGSSLRGSGSVFVGTGGPGTLTSVIGASFRFETPTAQIGTATITGDTVVRANTLGISNALTTANFTLEAANGSMVLGGNNAGVTLSDAAFGRIRVTGAASFYAGLTTPTVNVPIPVFGDLEVRGLTYDSSRVPTLNFYANSSREVRLFGPVDPVGPSSGLVRIGDPAEGSVWAPRTIKLMDPSDPITDLSTQADAAIRATTRRFELYATGDILIGSQRFVDLVANTPTEQIDLSRGLPVGVAPTPDEANRLYLLGAKATLVAGGRILTQNTSTTGGEVSIVLTGAGVPLDEPLLTIGRAQSAQVFVSFASLNETTSGVAVSLSDRIVRLQSDSGVGVLVNGCPLGLGCSLSSPANQFRLEQFQPAGAAGAPVDPPVLSPPPPVDDDERETETVTTGAGNEEIWRRPR